MHEAARAQELEPLLPMVFWAGALNTFRARRYGETIDAAVYADRIEAGEDEGELTRELLVRSMHALARLAGQPDFVLELAGRKWNVKETARS